MPSSAPPAADLTPIAETPEPHGWRRPFVIYRHHMEIGASRATQAGCSPLTVSLIRRHQEALRREPQNEEERLLVALQQADSVN